MTRRCRDSRTGRHLTFSGKSNIPGSQISREDGGTQLSLSSGLSAVVVVDDEDVVVVKRSVILYVSVPKSTAGVAGDVDDIDDADGKKVEPSNRGSGVSRIQYPEIGEGAN